MKNNRYISCTDKKVIIALSICLAIAILTTLLLHAVTPQTLFVTISIILILLFVTSWLGVIALAAIYVVGIILDRTFNKKKS